MKYFIATVIMTLALAVFANAAEVTLTWTDSKNPAGSLTGYKVERSLDPGPWTAVGTVPEGTRTMVDTVDVAGNMCWRVIAMAGDVPGAPKQACQVFPFAVGDVEITITLRGAVR